MKPNNCSNLCILIGSMWKHIGKNPEYVMVGDSEENRRGKQVREPLVTVPGSTSGFDKIGNRH